MRIQKACRGCCGLIPDTRRMDAVYCSNECADATRTEQKRLRGINQHRACRVCGEAISLKRRKDASYCSEVCAGRYRNRKFSGRVGKVDRQYTYRQRHPERYILSRIKNSSATRGLDFDIDVSDIVIPLVCPVLGIKLDTTNRGAGFHDSSPSVDRIRSELGYVKGNVRVISARANLLKSNATVEELRLVLADLERIHGIS